MCGLVAIWRPGGVTVEEVEQALDRMASRGPDARGLKLLDDGRLGIGHLRLSILDLSSAADQPMRSADGAWTIAYNGEAVNFRDVRASFPPGTAWRTDSDTEVLLEAFAARGVAALDDFVGMFAFAAHDAHRGVLHIVRDRFGIKPLYHSRLSDGGLAVASEIPPLLSLLGIPARADEDVVLTYLEAGLSDFGDRTFFAGVRALPPGCAARLDLSDGKLIIDRWYDFPRAVDRQRASPAKRLEDWVAEGLERIERAVLDHLVSDVPVGLNVSGGVDSSILCALARRRIDELHVFSQDYEPPYSELVWVKKVIGDARLHRVTLRERDILGAFSDTVRRQAEPFGGVFVIGYDALYRSAADAGVTVLLDGNGIDEAFLGYGKYRAIRDGRIAASAAVSIDGTAATRPDVITPILRRRAGRLWLPDYDGQFDHPVRTAAAIDLLHAKIPRGLRFNDRMSMGRSKELRVPFLDHRLVEFAFTVPLGLLLDGDTTKALFRTIASRLVGAEVAYAPKREVQSPQREWLAGPWAGFVEDVLRSGSFAARGWVEPARALAAFREYRDGDRQNSFAIWQWLNLELWAREALDR